MIAKIIGVILSLLNFVFMLIIRLILSVFPNLGLESLANVFESFFGLMTGAINFTYFLLGPAGWVIVDIVISLFIIKHLVLPVVNFVRRCVT